MLLRVKYNKEMAGYNSTEENMLWEDKKVLDGHWIRKGEGANFD